MKHSYCNSLTSYSKYKTREVIIGDIPMGGDNPIRVQSMTTTDTMDTEATVAECIRMIDAGCEYIRITAPSIKEAENLKHIKEGLKAKGYSTPLIADIHFTPNAAEVAARIIEKVRVNPGNYADKKKFEEIEYTDDTYQKELERIQKRFTPLVKICKEQGTAMRIGTNHGSLSDRILSRYGDTPEGMVESALEFLRICEENDYHNIVLSMKASNALVMVQAYRLLVLRMNELGMNYPLHLGVTEAGEGEDGRIKSAIGIGTLLEDGIGDTIRVSLTEAPEFEIPVAQALANRYLSREKSASAIEELPGDLPYSPFSFKKRTTRQVVNIGDKNVPRVIADFSDKEKITPAQLFAVGYNYSVPLDKWKITDLACDYIFAGDSVVDFAVPGTLGLIYNASTWSTLTDVTRSYPLFTVKEFAEATKKSTVLNFVRLTIQDVFALNGLDADETVVYILETNNAHGMAEQRRAFVELMQANNDVPVIVKRSYEGLSEDDFQLHASTDIGALFIDGFGDGVLIEQKNCASLQKVNATTFGILQGTRSRITKTEYISCPSCGRTLFDLQETTQKIRTRTDHLKGVKIGIMGCIVNGPGEMADADYGYVGTGVGKITLYKGQEVVERNVPSENAVDALINLIKDGGDWVELEA